VRRPDARSVVAAAATTVVSALPAFLVGGMAVLIRSDLGFSETALGATVSIGFLVAALGSAPAGLLVERIGGFLGMRIALAVTVVSLMGLGTAAVSWWHLTGFLALAGLGMALGSPASNQVVALVVPPGRQGAAFGLKTSAAPAATLIAGALLPLVAVRYGWEWSFRLMALAALVAVGLVPRKLLRPAIRPSHRLRGRPPLMGRLGLLALTAGFANAASTGMAAFYVESASRKCIDAGVAGALLTVGAATGIGARVLWGWWADRRAWFGWWHVAGMFSVGALAVAGVAKAASILPLALFTVVVFGSGWAWPGVFMMRAVGDFPATPAAATGIIAVGIFTGGVVGPLVVGALVEHLSMNAGWVAIGISMALAALSVSAAALVAHPPPERPTSWQATPSG